MNEMRIYVASLSDYNNGRLEGKWLDLSDYSDASELMEAIQEMLDDLTKKYNDGEVREEWAVHDYEGIPSTLASEYMGEQDFQQLYDIAEVADDRGIPVEVLVERAGDMVSDDYQALADSLMFVVDGSDESDIVYEYENQIGELGFDWWSNHVGITITDQRLLYGEDVDNFKEEILAENPDMDESEAEGQAEEMADAEEEARNSDLIEYLKERGYYDEFPNWVYKDYEKAWKSDLSYEWDVIHHDGEMYVFTNNYGLGGTILSGVIGAYIGYKIGRAKPQKKGFETEKKIGRKIKGAFSKKKMAQGGGVSYRSRDIDKIKVGDIVQYAHSNSEYEAEVIDIVYDSRFKELSSVTIKWLDNGKIQKSYLKDLMLSKDKKMAKGGNVNTGRSWHQDRRMYNKSESYEKPMSSRKKQYAQGGGVDYYRYDALVHFLTNDGENMEKEYIIPSAFSEEDAENRARRKFYREDFDRYDAEQIQYVSLHKREKSFAQGGGVERKYKIILGQEISEYDNLDDLIDDFEDKYTISEKKKSEIVYGNDLIKPKGQVSIKYAKGGGIGFKALSAKVAKRYEGKSVAPKYQSQYGTTYSKSEAKEVGDKVAGKVYWQQQGRKMAKGGGVKKRSLMSVAHLVDWKSEGIKKWYIRSYPTDDLGEEINDTITFKDLWDGLHQKQDVYEIIGVGDSIVRERLFQYLSLLYNVDYSYVYDLWLSSVNYAQGGGVDLFSMSKTINDEGQISEMVIAENVSVEEFNKLFSDKGYRKVNDKTLVGFYFAKPNGDTIQLIPSFHKKGEIVKYAKGGSTYQGGGEIAKDVLIDAWQNGKRIEFKGEKYLVNKRAGAVQDFSLAKGGEEYVLLENPETKKYFPLGLYEQGGSTYAGGGGVGKKPRDIVEAMEEMNFEIVVMVNSNSYPRTIPYRLLVNADSIEEAKKIAREQTLNQIDNKEYIVEVLTNDEWRNKTFNNKMAQGGGISGLDDLLRG